MTLVNSPKSITIETLKEAAKVAICLHSQIGLRLRSCAQLASLLDPFKSLWFRGAKLMFEFSSLHDSFEKKFLLERDDSKEEQEGATDAVKDEHDL